MARSNDHIGVDDQEFYQLLDKDGVADDIRLFNKTLRQSLALRSDPSLFRVRTQADPALRFCCHSLRIDRIQTAQGPSTSSSSLVVHEAQFVGLRT